MIQNIKNTCQLIGRFLLDFLVRLYAVVAVLYITTTLFLALALSVALPQFIPVVLLATCAAIGLGVGVHMTLSSIFNFLTRPRAVQVAVAENSDEAALISSSTHKMRSSLSPSDAPLRSAESIKPIPDASRTLKRASSVDSFFLPQAAVNTPVEPVVKATFVA